MLSFGGVKLCGLTRAEDVALGLELQATALGFVHYDRSPRSAEIEAIAELVGLARGRAACVLVVVDSAPHELAQLVERTGVDAVQLCGAESAADWRAFPVPIWRRLPVEAGASPQVQAWAGVAQGFVLDHPAAPGGTGLGVDLELAAGLSARAPCLLAGGIHGGNVAERVARVRPAGVDASSSLERAPGIKDPDLVRDYLTRARGALAALEQTP